MPDKQEGELTVCGALVRGENIAKIALKMSPKWVHYAFSWRRDVGRSSKPYILANVFEAFLGAIYLDLGYEAVKNLYRATRASDTSWDSRKISPTSTEKSLLSRKSTITFCTHTYLHRTWRARSTIKKPILSEPSSAILRVSHGKEVAKNEPSNKPLRWLWKHLRNGVIPCWKKWKTNIPHIKIPQHFTGGFFCENYFCYLITALKIIPNVESTIPMSQNLITMVSSFHPSASRW